MPRAMGNKDFQSDYSVGVLGRPVGHQYYVPRPVPKFSYRSSLINMSSFRGMHKSKSVLNNSPFYPKVASEGNSQGDNRPSTSLLLQDVLGSQKERDGETDNRPVGFEPDALCPEIQNGDDREDRSEHSRTYVGMFSRHHRRLSPRPCGVAVPQVFRVCSEREGFCLPGSSLRSVISPLGLLKSDEGHQEIPARGGSGCVLVPGRFPYPGKFSPSVGATPRPYSQIAGGPRLLHQLRQVVPFPCPEIGISRSDPGFGKSHFVPSTVQSGENFVSLSGVPEEVCDIKEGSRISGGSPELCIGLCSSRKTLSSSCHPLDESSYSDGNSRPYGPARRRDQDSSKSLVCVRFPNSSSSDAHPFSNHRDDDRRIGSWLEWNSPPAQGRRSMGARGLLSINELEGVESYPSVSSALCGFSEGQDGQGPFGQFYSPFLPETSGFSVLGFPSGSLKGDFGVLPGSVHSSDPLSHQGRSERSGGSRFQRGSDLYGVDPGRIVLQLDLQSVWSSRDRFVRDEIQYSVAPICFSLPRQISCRCGCFLPKLGSLVVSLPFSSPPSPSRRDPEVAGIRRIGGAGGPLLANSQLVSSPVSKMPNVPSSPSVPCPFPVHVQGPGVPPKPFRLEASRLEAIRQGLVESLYSSDAIEVLLQQHRSSTRNQYQSHWSKFIIFLDLDQVDHNSICLSTVLNFLAFHARRDNLAYRTLAGYRCALRHPLYFMFNLDINCLESESFMRGLFNSNPPVRRAPMPVWSLEDLLIYLKVGPFEPLQEARGDLLLQKTLVLLLLASGRRISEIAHISKKSRVCDGRIILQWLPYFRAKHDSKDFRPEDPSISRLESRDDSDLLLCPVRAWSIYSSRWGSVPTVANDSCFWHFNQPHLSYVIRKLLRDSRKFTGALDQVKVGPHHLRKLAASYSHTFLRQSVEDDKVLMNRMGSASMSVLKRCYISEVSPLKFPCVFPLGTLQVSVSD